MPDPFITVHFALQNRAKRFLWGIVQASLFRWSPRFCHAWRAMLLRLFGARIGKSCHVYPNAKIWAPWNLQCEDVVAIADGAYIYNPSDVHLGSHVVVSQEAFLCGAS